MVENLQSLAGIARDPAFGPEMIIQIIADTKPSHLQTLIEDSTAYYQAAEHTLAAQEPVDPYQDKVSRFSSYTTDFQRYHAKNVVWLQDKAKRLASDGRQLSPGELDELLDSINFVRGTTQPEAYAKVLQNAGMTLAVQQARIEDAERSLRLAATQAKVAADVKEQRDRLGRSTRVATFIAGSILFTGLAVPVVGGGLRGIASETRTTAADLRPSPERQDIETAVASVGLGVTIASGLSAEIAGYAARRRAQVLLATKAIPVST